MRMLGSRNARTHRERWPASLAILVVLVCLAGTVLAGDEPAWDWTPGAGSLDAITRARSTPLPRTGERPASLQDHLLQSLEGQFQDFAGYRVTPVPAAREVDEHTHRILTETASERVRRGSRRALEDYLRATTPVGPLIERIEAMNPLDRIGGFDPLRGAGERQGPERKSRGRGIDLGIGFNHLTPGLELERKVGEGSIRTMIDVLGWVELEYEQGGSSRTRFHLGYDARSGEAVAGCRIGF
jgi:hypothetical protein